MNIKYDWQWQSIINFLKINSWRLLDLIFCSNLKKTRLFWKYNLKSLVIGRSQKSCGCKNESKYGSALASNRIQTMWDKRCDMNWLFLPPPLHMYSTCVQYCSILYIVALGAGLGCLASVMANE